MKKAIFSLLAVSLMLSMVSAWGSSNSYTNDYSWDVRKTMLPMLCKADINHNGIIDLWDLHILQSDYGKKVRKNHEAFRSDLDNSGMVGLRDLKLMQGWLGTPLYGMCHA